MLSLVLVQEGNNVRTWRVFLHTLACLSSWQPHFPREGAEGGAWKRVIPSVPPF